ncbi:MAG: VF530 family DNA-binding protein [Bermanella sp.]
MTDEPEYKNNPLHGISLKNILIELSDHYSFEIMFAYLNINCFKTNPSIESSVKFLKKTDWAREKVEAFYMYQFKSLPKATGAQFNLSPRDRIVPAHQSAGEPAELSLEDAEHRREIREKKAAEFTQGSGRRSGTGKNTGGYRGSNSTSKDSNRDGGAPRPSSSTSADGKVDPWASWKK